MLYNYDKNFSCLFRYSVSSVFYPLIGIPLGYCWLYLCCYEGILIFGGESISL
uniref:Uncharacterized protein n=1 Tax=Anguilla anguilla TaxID=7936 RepID=A0A0E9PHN8_ANGAN